MEKKSKEAKNEYMRQYNRDNRERLKEYSRLYQRQYYYARKTGVPVGSIIPKKEKELPDLPFPTTRNEKLEYIKAAGWYLKDGNIYTNRDNKWKDKNCIFQIKDKRIGVRKASLIWFLHHNEYPPITITFKNGDNTDLSIDNLIDRKSIPRKTPTPRVKKSGAERDRPKYIDSNDLTYEIILSQGIGKLTDKAHLMLYSLCEELIKKFNYKNDENGDIKYDVKMYAYSSIIESWQGFDFVRYNGDYSSFSYFTELTKRAIVSGFREQTGYRFGINPHMVSINSFYF